MKNSSVLTISDTHFPYNHPDVVAFLKALKEKYRPDRVVHIGDEVDFHAISFHDSNPDLLSPGDELQTSINRMKPLYDLFPKMDLVESNHGSLVYRKAKHHGIPAKALRTYRDILSAPRGWNWHFDLTLRLSNGSYCYFHHGKSSNGLRLSQSMGMNVVQGHFHESFGVQYWGNPLGLFWSMQIGCLIERDTFAFEYCKNNLKRPVIGTGVIINGHPKLEPMVLTNSGRWTGKLV